MEMYKLHHEKKHFNQIGNLGNLSITNIMIKIYSISHINTKCT